MLISGNAWLYPVEESRQHEDGVIPHGSAGAIPQAGPFRTNVHGMPKEYEIWPGKYQTRRYPDLEALLELRRESMSWNVEVFKSLDSDSTTWSSLGRFGETEQLAEHLKGESEGLHLKQSKH
ncbi:hypothetical protein ABW19_dt0207560 [Dactylella cylindrospora]|nr:hypothetical protein ABW19_dt0207560 [Dactylella cylindrospora]